MAVLKTPPAALTDLMRSPLLAVPVTASLLLVNGLVFMAMLLAGAGWWHTANGVQLAWGANFGPATQDGQWWRLFTAMFIHFGVVHLALNMWALWDVGRLVERLIGRWRFVALYLGSGVLGNLVSLVVQGNQAVSGGASGAVFSLFGALLVFLWRERAQVDRSEFRWLFGGALGFSAAILAMGFVVKGIDNAAHMGGLVAGLLLGLVLARPWTTQSPGVQRGRSGAAAVLVFGIALLVLRLPEPLYRYGEEIQVRNAIQSYVQQDIATQQQWNTLLQTGPASGLSFNQIAGRVDSDIAPAYARSFEQLMQVRPTTAVPSAQQLVQLQTYAAQRAEAAHELADSLRSNDAQTIRRLLNPP
jgi:rhomboid protease GluP